MSGSNAVDQFEVNAAPSFEPLQRFCRSARVSVDQMRSGSTVGLRLDVLSEVLGRILDLARRLRARSRISTFAPVSRAASAATAPAAPAPITTTGTDVEKVGRRSRMTGTAVGSVGGQLRLDPGQVLAGLAGLGR